jgi:hypothetical protein
VCDGGPSPSTRAWSSTRTGRPTRSKAAQSAEKRTAVNDDPQIVPRIVGVAEPIRFPPGSCSAMTELSESCVAQSFPR